MPMRIRTGLPAMLGAVRREGPLDLDCTVEGAAHARKGEQEAVALRLDFGQDPPLLGFKGRVSDSGEGRWSLQAPVEEGVPEPVLSGALTQRFASRGAEDVADKGRYQFGGHEEKSS
jgi:hypothetical protein